VNKSDVFTASIDAFMRLCIVAMVCFPATDLIPFNSSKALFSSSFQLVLQCQVESGQFDEQCDDYDQLLFVLASLMSYMYESPVCTVCTFYMYDI
jgi:hypothetical protein